MGIYMQMKYLIINTYVIVWRIEMLEERVYKFCLEDSLERTL